MHSTLDPDGSQVTISDTETCVQDSIIADGDVERIQVNNSLENVSDDLNEKENTSQPDLEQMPAYFATPDESSLSTDVDADWNGADPEQGGISKAVIAGRDIYRIRIRNAIANLFEEPIWKGFARRNREVMLAKMDSFWIDGVLNKSLHDLTVIELGMVDQSDAVDSPFNIFVKQSAQPARVLPTNTSIVQVFDQSGGALLILGDPGSGKTTILLSLAQAKIVTAQEDLTQPIPVVFNLSSWSTTRKEISEWLVDELRVKYRVPSRVSRAWITDRELLLLLDGLDEVKPDYRNACVHALNVFSQQYGFKNIVICSRVADYAVLSTRLSLPSAVLLQPLTPDQINSYLSNAGDTMAAVRSCLEVDQPLQQLARSPLMLSVMTLAYRGKTVQELLSFASVAERRHHLFDTYVAQMYSRVVRTKNKAFSSSQTTTWLTWLARQMSRHSLSEFLIEQLQPSWLSTHAEQRVYFIISRLIAATIIGLAMGLLNVGLNGTPGMQSVMGTWQDIIVQLLPNKILNFFLGIVLGSIGGIAIGFFDAKRLIPRGGAVDSESRVRKITAKTTYTLSIFMLIGFLLSVIDSIVVQLVLGNNDWIFIPVGGGRYILDPARLFKQVLFSGGIMGLLLGMLVIGPSLCLIFEFRNREQHLASDIRPVETLTWSWRGLLRGAANTGLLMDVSVSIVGFLILILAFSAQLAVDTINKRWGSGLNFVNIAEIVLKAFAGAQLLGLLIGGPFGAIIGGPIAAVRGRAIDRKSTVNQGIRQSVRNAMVGATVFPATSGCAFISLLVLGPTIILVAMFLASLVVDQYTAPQEVFVEFQKESANLYNDLGLAKILALFVPDLVAFIIGILGSIGIVASLWYGGFAAIQHFTVRLMLSIHRKIPWNYSRFLDYAAERVFLQKVGGSYIFVHRLLLEHFATLQPPESGQGWGEPRSIETYSRATSAATGPSRLPAIEETLGSRQLGRRHRLFRHSIRFYATLMVGIQLTVPIFFCATAVFSTDIEAAARRLHEWGWTGSTSSGSQDKFLVVISRFESLGEKDYVKIDGKIKQKIEIAINELELPNVSVEVKRERLAAGDHIAAQEMGRDCDANVIIWGTDTGTLVTANVLNLKAQNSDSGVTEIKKLSSDAEQLASEVTFLVLFAIGQSYESQGAYDDCAKIIERAIETLPSATTLPKDLARAYVLLGWLRSSDDSARSLMMYNKAIELNPEYAAAYRSRADVRRDQGDLEGAIDDYDKATELNPDDAIAFYNRGIVRGDLDDLTGAIADYSEAITIDPTFAAAYNNRGIARENLGYLEEAIADYSKAIESSPTLVEAYNNRGLARRKQGDLDGAIADYDTALQLNPNLVTVYHNRAAVREDKGDLEGAIADYSKVIELNPSDSNAYFNRASARSQLGNLDGAIADYSSVLENNPSNAAAYNNRGHARARQGNFDEAIEDYSRAIDLNPDLATAYRNRGTARYLNHEVDVVGAIADFSKAIEFNPSDAYMYLWRGTLFLRQGNVEEAQSDFDAATKWASTDGHVYTTICWYYALAQQPEVALPYCQKGIALGDSLGHRDVRGLTYALLGDYQSAITDFEVAIEWAEQQEDSAWQAKATVRKAWVTELRAGKNPFTEDLLETLW